MAAPGGTLTQGYIRPYAGIVTGQDGLVYAGWGADYGHVGGALTITDPMKDATVVNTRVLEDPFGNDLAVSSVAVATIDAAHSYLSLGSTRAPSGNIDQTGTIERRVFDPDALKKPGAPPSTPLYQRTYPLAAATSVSTLRYDATTERLMVGLSDGTFDVLDVR